MSSPIHHGDDTDPTLIYAPRWAREPAAESPPRYRARTTAPAKVRAGKAKPKFSGDRAVLALQRQLALDPDLIPEPLSKGTAVIRPLLMRLCSVTALAAVVAWGLVSYSSVKKTPGITTSTTAIASNQTNAVNAQPSQLRPPLSHAADTLAPVGNSRPVAIASAAAAAVTSAPVAVTAPTETAALAPASSKQAIDRRPLPPDSEEIATLIKRGKDLLANGDLAAARLLLRRAAEAGSAEGALLLGSTFDPVALQRLGAIGAAPDLAKARQWYQRAAELGSSAASQQLAGIADSR
ncbi:MAG: SEL1-like repeat protein [Rhizobiales bacterium]|nr:SEL1-like repeat protein [Hyphomicrobiales bacterium]